MFFLPVFMQELLGFTALKSGVALMPRALVMMVATPIVGKLYNRVPPRVLVAIGLVCVAFGSIDMGHFTLETSDLGIIRTLLLQGVGFACLFVPLTTVALSHIPRTQLTDASGLHTVVRQFGGSTGLAIYGTLLDQFAIRARAALADHIDPHRPEVTQWMDRVTHGLIARGVPAGNARSGALGVLEGIITRQGAVIAFEKVFMLTGFMMLALLVLTPFLNDPQRGSGGASAPPPAPAE
jgi:DHA2 family multidrug resistance protein